MFNTTFIIAIICIYVGLLFVIAMWVEKKSKFGKRLGNSAIIYSLSLAIYCTSWTYYGSVGNVTSSGILFLSIYLGPTLIIALWWIVLRKLVRIKHIFRINSIADFIAARYNNSQALAAIVTVIVIIGIAPYIALQFKSIISTFSIITVQGNNTSWIANNVGSIVLILMIVFTIIFGVRHLDPTERHQGMIVAVAVESLVKIITFLIIGIFITYFVFDGFNDIFTKFQNSKHYYQAIANNADQSITYIRWLTYLILSMAAIMFLPRQFHVAVVENSNESHIRHSMWIFPLYLFIINIFVLPIAMAGLLQGFAIADADTFVLKFPMHYNQNFLSLLVFLGGFSAATSMIMISSMTMATMITNHLILPVINMGEYLSFLKRHILRIKWFAVALVISLGYWFEATIGQSYTLVNIGIMSFAAALQFAPSILGGIFWRKGNKAGALIGLVSGFLIWFYTLLLPSFVKSGWLSISILKNNFLTLGLFKPELFHFFSSEHLEPLTHTVFWSMVFNIGFYIIGSLVFKTSEKEKKVANAFVDILADNIIIEPIIDDRLYVELDKKEKIIKDIFCQFFSKEYSNSMYQRCLDSSKIKNRKQIKLIELTELCDKAEKLLAGSTGAAIAHKIFKKAKIFTFKEKNALSSIYGEMIVNLKLTPSDVKNKIDYYKEREQMISSHALALEIRNEELMRFITAIDQAGDIIIITNPNGFIRYVNPAFEKTTGYLRIDVIGTDTSILQKNNEKISLYSIINNIAKKDKNWHGHIINQTKQNVSFEAKTTVSVVKNSLGEIINFVILMRDVTMEVELERKLRQSQKMEAIGTLASGIAHDFNNLLSVILGYSQVILDDLHEDSFAKDGIKEIYTAGERARDLVKQILIFSRKAKKELVPVDVGLLLKEVIRMLSATIQANVKITHHDQATCKIVNADPVQIHQLIMNLGTNAFHALQLTGGIISFTLENLSIKSDNLPDKLKIIGEKDFLCLTVKDNGHGMEDNVLERIFEPYFTTKKEGKGTGLGLAVVHGIVMDINGAIDVKSKLQKGTSFYVYLPLMNSNDEKKNGEDDLSLESEKGENILFIDSEYAVTIIGEKLISLLGYNVTAESDGNKALEILKSKKIKFDLVFVNAMMLIIAGFEFLSNIKQIYPNIPVILTTGNEEIDIEKTKTFGICQIVKKPFSIQSIGQAIKNTLDKNISNNDAKN